MRKIFAIVCAGFAVAALVFAGHYLRVLPPQVHDAAEFGITPYISTHDADDDGLDDQSDMLAATRDYLAQKPRYRSAYFAGGWPTDGTGVCTDVVAYALLGAGYDLRALVDADIAQAPDAYGIELADANIDYRRVRNLRVFFDRNAEALTLDTRELAAWQGGDIVCWDNHIGIVSDKRNAQGKPLVLHHASALQLRYEEDVIDADSYGPICGHWRWNPKDELEST